MSEETFDRIAAEYDESLPPHVVEHYLAKRVELVCRAAPPSTYPRLLDVGCGTGVLADRLAARGYEATGIDPSQGMLDIMAAEHPEVDAVRGSGEELPFSDSSFDVVLTVAALHHIATPVAIRATLGEMVRVTRPGGRIVVWDHNPRNPYWKRLMARVPQDDGSERLIPEQEVLAGLISCGGRVLDSRQLGLVPDFVPARLLGAAQVGERIAERTPGLRRLCAHNVVVATSA
jgi:SAM-dependent methyltransferase